MIAFILDVDLIFDVYMEYVCAMCIWIFYLQLRPSG